MNIYDILNHKFGGMNCSMAEIRDLRNYGIKEEIEFGFNLEGKDAENYRNWLETGLRDKKIRNANDKIDVIIHRLEGLKDRINEAWMVDCETHEKNIKSSIIWYVLEDEE